MTVGRLLEGASASFSVVRRVLKRACVRDFSFRVELRSLSRWRDIVGVLSPPERERAKSETISLRVSSSVQSASRSIRAGCGGGGVVFCRRDETAFGTLPDLRLPTLPTCRPVQPRQHSTQHHRGYFVLRQGLCVGDWPRVENNSEKLCCAHEQILLNAICLSTQSTLQIHFCS